MDAAPTPEQTLEIKELLEAINLKYDIDFRHYTASSVRRSLALAIDRMKFKNLAALKEKVLKDVDSFNELLQSLTNSSSEFFRDPTYFLAIREQVVRALKTYPSIKVWVAGCSTGEEVYSLAILLLEEELLERTTIYATDINARNLAAAARGHFDLELTQSFSENYLKSGGKYAFSDYYKVVGHSAQFSEELKKSITFSDHSLVTDSVFSETHFISCRNVLIYFDRELQDRAFSLFYESLCRKGFLGLGAKETIQFSKHARHFEAFIKNERIFRKKQ